MVELLSEDFQRKMEECITDVEKKTSAEVVIAVSRKSGEYRDTCYLGGMMLALISLCCIMFCPFFVVHPYAVIPDVIFFFLCGYLFSKHYPVVVYLLTTARRRNHQVQKAAEIAFLEEGVSATKDRTGILFYISLFEKRVEILPDLGIDGRIPRAEWNQLRHDLNNLMRKKGQGGKFLEHLCRSGAILEKALPALGENPDEIPNRPRIRN